MSYILWPIDFHKSDNYVFINAMGVSRITSLLRILNVKYFLQQYLHGLKYDKTVIILYPEAHFGVLTLNGRSITCNFTVYTIHVIFLFYMIYKQFFFFFTSNLTLQCVNCR